MESNTEIDNLFKSVELTIEEKEILDLLSKAYLIFCTLPKYHPYENMEYMELTHRLQCLIAYRIAHRAQPKTFGCSTKV